MKSMQKKIMEHIEAHAKKRHGLESAVDHNYSNTGRVVFSDPGALESRGVLRFSFQNGCAKFTWGESCGPNIVIVDYDKPQIETKVNDAIRRCLKAA